MVIGKLQVFHLHVYALLDPRASLSFVTPYVAVNLGVSLEILADSFSVSTIVGKSIIPQQVYRNYAIMISQKVTSADLVELEINDFNVILDMDQLYSYYASIDCRNKIVQFQLLNEPFLECRGSTSTLRSTYFLPKGKENNI